jgi:hypothetical protein
MFIAKTHTFQLLSKSKHRENEGVTTARTPILQTCQNWHNHLPNKTIVVQVIVSEWIVSSNTVIVFKNKYLSHGMTSSTMPHSRQGFSAGERTVLYR